MTPRTLPRAHSRRSRRLALVAGLTLMIGTGGVASAGTDDSAAPTTTVAAGGGKVTPAPAGTTTTVPTDASAPAGTEAAVQPLAVIEIGATGPGLDIGTALDGATAVANLQMTNMPVAAGATVAEYSARYSGDLNDPAVPEYYGSLSIISTAQSEMPAAEILAAYQAALTPLATFEATTGSATSEGVTTDQLLLDVVDDGSTTPAAVGNYEIFVSRSEEAPGLVAIEVNQTMPYTEGPLPAIPAAVEAEFAVPLGLAATNGWTITDWDYSDGFNQFSGGTPYSSLGLGFSAGTGDAADLLLLGEQIVTQVGTPTYEDVESDRFFYSFDDESDWSGSIRDYWVGNELAVTWSASF